MQTTTRRNWFKGLAGLVVAGAAAPVLTKEWKPGRTVLHNARSYSPMFPLSCQAPTPPPPDLRTPQQVWDEQIQNEVSMIVDRTEADGDALYYRRYISGCSAEVKEHAFAVFAQRGETVEEFMLGGKPAFSYRGQTWRVYGA